MKEIARRGGGILNSAGKLHETSEEELFNQSMVTDKGNYCSWYRCCRD